jgi:Spy/CpxP family protein refolding chaperone
MKKFLTAMITGSMFTLSALAAHAADQPPPAKEEKKAGTKDVKKPREESPKQ